MQFKKRLEKFAMSGSGLNFGSQVVQQILRVAHKETSQQRNFELAFYRDICCAIK